MVISNKDKCLLQKDIQGGIEMEQYNVTGMSCAACSSRVEKAVSKVPGVTSCSVSLLTNSMGVKEADRQQKSRRIQMPLPY